MRIGVAVGDVMTRNFVSIKPDSDIIDCVKTMTKHKVGSLIIQENKELRGILTKGDIIKAIAEGKDITKISAEKIMSRRVVTIGPDRDMYEALLIMKKKKVRWLPVIKNKKVIGFLTVKDILRIEPSLFDIAMEGTEIKEEEEKLRALERARKQKGERDVLAIGPRWSREGECEECGDYGPLYKIDGRLLCTECVDKLKEE